MRILVPIALLLAASLWPALGHTADTVPVRAWPHAGYGRLVFDWNAPVDYTAEIRDGRLVVEFDRPFEADLKAALDLLKDYVDAAQADPAGRTLRFQLRAPYRLRHFVANGSVVVDLMKAESEAKAPTDAHAYAYAWANTRRTAGWCSTGPAMWTTTWRAPATLSR